MGSYLKRTDDLQRLKTRELIYQNINGDYPIEGGVPYFVDASGTFGTSTITIDNTGNMVIPGDLGVGGAINFGGSLSVSTLNVDSLDVSGPSQIGGSLDVSGNLKVNGSTELVGPVVARSTVAVAGTSNTGPINTTGNVDVSGTLMARGRAFLEAGFSTQAPCQLGSATTPIQAGLTIYGNVSVAASAAGGGDAGFSGTVTANIGRFGSLDVSGVSSNTITLYPQPGMGTFASPIVLSDGQNFQAVGNKCFVMLSGNIYGSSARVITPIVPSGKAIPVNYLIYNGGPGASITVSPTTLDLTLTLSPSSPDASFAIVFL